MDWESFYNSFRKPDFIPGFEIQNRLGGGAFGDVYKARKTSIGKAYAIKFLKLEDDSQREAVERELSHVRHFASIDHPNLVTIEDLGSVMGVPYLVMGYAGEDTLARRLKDGPLPCDEGLQVFVQAARGVLALHDRRLVHFDLKPSNIFLKGDVARVGDYGLSKLLEGGRTTLSIGRGTPQYMAPEILRSRADHRADIYSLGVILFESLTGELPYRPEAGGALVLRDSDDPPAFPAACDAPRRVRDVILRCLHLAPDDRYVDVGDLLADLGQSARRGESVMFVPGSLTERAPSDDGWVVGGVPNGAKVDAPGAGAVRPTPTGAAVPETPRTPSAKLAAALAAERTAREQGAPPNTGTARTPFAPGTSGMPGLPGTSPASPPGADAGTRARALVRGLADFHGEPSAPPQSAVPVAALAPPAPPSPFAGPVPVPPRVGGGFVGGALATTRIAIEVLLALLAGLARAGVFAWRALVERLLSRRGTVVRRAGRLVVFVLVMAGLGFVVTLLGMVGLLLFERASHGA